MPKRSSLTLLLLLVALSAGHGSAQGIIHCDGTDCPGCKAGLSCTGYPLDITEAPDAVGRCSFDGTSGCLYCSDTDPCPGTGWQCTKGVDDASLRNYFNRWQSTFGQSYQEGTADYDRRIAIFRQNLQGMVAFNQQPGITYWVAPNRWSALTYDEFASVALGEASGDEGTSSPAAGTNSTRGRRSLRQSTPSKVDWTAQGKQCGSCWSHAAVGAVESKLLIAGGPSVDLSEQMCVDCVSGSGGCSGGHAFQCLQYIAEHGIADEASYPYTASDGQCQANKAVAVKAAGPGYVHIQPESRGALLQAVSNQPTVVSYWADQSFQHFGGGVYTGSSQCSNSKTNHAVLATGFDMSPGEVAFWIIKNSWGEGWPSDNSQTASPHPGHFRIAMAPDGPGTCQL
ncbi:ervatamin-B-like [Chlorella sorokiniana]|uniref:Ervatamin-B-like n=1 Tax=Chlorella sorokiniana TaxID=3076 RepID=A0A2P6TY92_CHLSO|nr:ervatamin-B-like [Chlorella sorokiniana]|eukprot:PRW59039.1 ervatamin-B-like [Chlorella sorokiniana]